MEKTNTYYMTVFFYCYEGYPIGPCAYLFPLHSTFSISVNRMSGCPYGLMSLIIYFNVDLYSDPIKIFTLMWHRATSCWPPSLRHNSRGHYQHMSVSLFRTFCSNFFLDQLSRKRILWVNLELVIAKIEDRAKL